jgi:hypothetical protein
MWGVFYYLRKAQATKKAIEGFARVPLILIQRPADPVFECFGEACDCIGGYAAITFFKLLYHQDHSSLRSLAIPRPAFARHLHSFPISPKLL